MDEKLEQAHSRMDVLGFTESEQDFIFSDWPNWDEHIDWLLNASPDEIADWGDTANWGQKQRKRHKPGTPPDTSLYLGETRREWLKAQGGIQPTIQRMVDDAIEKSS